jgi:hypothetical protein
MGGAMGGGPDGTGNTGAELPGGAQSEFARTTGGQTEGVTAAPSFGNPATGAGGAQPGGTDRGGGGGSMSGTTGSMTSGSIGGQSVGSVGTIGSAGEDNEYGAQPPSSGQSSTGASGEPLGADHQNSAKGGSVVSAGSGSTGPGPGQTGTDRGSEEDMSETEERSS